MLQVQRRGSDGTCTCGSGWTDEGSHAPRDGRPAERGIGRDRRTSALKVRQMIAGSSQTAGVVSVPTPSAVSGVNEGNHARCGRSSSRLLSSFELAMIERATRGLPARHQPSASFHTDRLGTRVK